MPGPRQDAHGRRPATESSQNGSTWVGGFPTGLLWECHCVLLSAWDNVPETFCINQHDFCPHAQFVSKPFPSEEHIAHSLLGSDWKWVEIKEEFHVF